jgi:amino acid transporter
MPTSATRQLPLLSLVGIVFFIVCGGTYGLEEAVNQAGPWWTIVLVVAIPFLWSVPVSLMVAELATLMPEEGGYYAWISAKLGPFWGCQAGCWALCAGAVDMALYPKLFVHYLSHLVPSWHLDAPLAGWLAAACLVGIALALNLRGARTVGRNAVLGLALVLGPLLAFSAIVMWQHSPLETVSAVVRSAPDKLTVASFAAGLSIVMWNYMGWDSASTLAGEVENPQRNYPRALALVAVLTVSVYLLPLLAGLTIVPEKARWSEWTIWPSLGQQVAGAWLGIAIAAAGLFAQWSLFNSNLLYVSRIPHAMARDGWLPAALARTTGRAGSPAATLCVLAAIAAGLAAFPFEKLVVIDVLLYSAVLVLEFTVLIRLRLREPHEPRPFRIPGGWPGIGVVTLAPAVCAGLLLWTTLSPEPGEGAAAQYLQLAAVAAVVASGVALYFARRFRLAPARA